MSKTVLITGAGTGIGAATARHFAAGNEVIVHFRSSRDAAEAVAASVRSAGGQAHLVQADLSNEEGCRTVAAFAAERCDQLDLLVNNVGGLIRRCA